MSKGAWEFMRELIEEQVAFQSVIITAAMDERMKIRNELPAGNVWMADDTLIVSDGSFELKYTGRDCVESEDEKTFVVRNAGVTVKFIFD